MEISKHLVEMKKDAPSCKYCGGGMDLYEISNYESGMYEPKILGFTAECWDCGLSIPMKESKKKLIQFLEGE